jgi:hypothetical protein
VRLDILERIEETLNESMRDGRDAEQVTTLLVSLLGSSKDEALELAAALGFARHARIVEGADTSIWRRLETRNGKSNRHRPGKRQHGKSKTPAHPDSPFAQLAALMPAD